MQRIQIGVLLLAALTVSCGAARADRAIVVGVNQYDSLPGANLKGCVNDANAMAGTLKQYHFQVVLLTDQQATKSGITSALSGMASAIQPGERFAFYFAGHGTQASDGKAVLLPSDAQESSEANDLGADELNQAIAAIPAASHTVILDSCFSGGMMRSFKRGLGTHPHLKTRYFARGHSKDLVIRANGDDDNHQVAQSSNICYYTATRENEQAGEDDFDTERHGVFTHYLTSRLTGTEDLWGDVQTAVSAKVADYMDDMQHPTLSPAFSPDPVFDNGSKPDPDPAPAPPAPETLWDVYNEDHADADQVLLTMAPNRTTVVANKDNIAFNVKAGADGYLIVLERGTSGKINLLYPASRSAADAQVQAGKIVKFPSDGSTFQADTPGNERIKAILFTSQDAAAAMLAQIPASRSLTRLGMKRRDLQMHRTTTGGTDTFATSDIIFEVVPQ